MLDRVANAVPLSRPPASSSTWLVSSNQPSARRDDGGHRLADRPAHVGRSGIVDDLDAPPHRLGRIAGEGDRPQVGRISQRQLGKDVPGQKAERGDRPVDQDGQREQTRGHGPELPVRRRIVQSTMLDATAALRTMARPRTGQTAGNRIGRRCGIMRSRSRDRSLNRMHQQSRSESGLTDLTERSYSFNKVRPRLHLRPSQATPRLAAAERWSFLAHCVPFNQEIGMSDAQNQQAAALGRPRPGRARRDSRGRLVFA